MELGLRQDERWVYLQLKLNLDLKMTIKNAEISPNSDDEITAVKKLFKGTQETPSKSTTRSEQTLCDKTDIMPENSSQSRTSSTDIPPTMPPGNQELQESVHDLLSQAKLLKSENQKLLKLREERERELKTLRTKVKDLTIEKEKIESVLVRSKADNSKVTAQLACREEETTKLKTVCEKLKKEKSELVGKLANVKAQADKKLSGDVENKILNEVSDLRKP